MLKKTNSQFAVEFIVLIAFMFLIFLGVIAIMAKTVIDTKENERQKIAEDIAKLVENEIFLAKSMEDGYRKTFYLPGKVDGSSYDIKIIDNIELVINYVDKEFVLFLPEKVCGYVDILNNEISKEEGIVCVNTNFNLEQCQNIEIGGLCDDFEDGLHGTKCCCCLRYDLCC